MRIFSREALEAAQVHASAPSGERVNRARKCVERCSLAWRVLQQHMLDDGPHTVPTQWDSEFDLTCGDWFNALGCDASW